MLRLHRSVLAVIILALFAKSAAAQSLPAADLHRPFTAESSVAMPALTQAGGGTTSRDSVWNGALIGLGAGIGATMALDAVFCDNGFGGCDTPWAGYITLGAIGAGAGAGIDWLIGRNSNPGRTGLRVVPIVGRTRRGVAASLVWPARASLPEPIRAQQQSSQQPRDSVWNGTWIGAGIGAASGFVWSRSVCGWNDDECAFYTGLVGIPSGVGIGAAVGAIADALH